MPETGASDVDSASSKTGALPDDDWRVTGLGLAWIRRRLEDHVRVLRRDRPAVPDAGGEAISDLEADWLLRGPGVGTAPSTASDAARQEYDAARASLRAAGTPAAIDRIAALFGLAPFDEDVLLLAAAPRLEAAFTALFGYAHDRLVLQSASAHLINALFVPDTGGTAAGARLAPEAPLRRFALLTVPEGGLGALTPLMVDERVAGYLAGRNSPAPHVLPLLRPVPPEPLPARFTSRLDPLANRMKAGRDTAALLIGPRGSGRRGAAAALARRFALAPMALDVQSMPAERVQLRSRLALLAREARLCRLALVVDLDAGAAAQGAASAPDRPSADDILCGLEAPLFLLSETPVRTSFSTPVEHFDSFTASDRMEIWRAALGDGSAEDEPMIEAVAEQFTLGPADVVQLAAERNGGPPEALWQACRRYARTGLDGLAERIEPRFGWDDIVLSPGIDETLRAIVAQAQWRSTVYGRWGFGRKLSRGRGVSALFAGPSGVGKTMAAEVIAGALELDLLRVDLAGVVSKYIGETEKNLRRVFDGAEAAGAVLFFDEADALFGKRSEVKDSHDRYANVEVSYLLQKMETFHGVSILATNMKSHLDTAFLRRLRYVVEFPFPDAALRREIWARSFPAEAPTETLDFERLSRIEMAGGSITVAAINAAFLAAAAQSPIRMEHVATAAESELRKHGKEQRLTWLRA